MKLKKITLGILGALSLLALVATTSQAGSGASYLQCESGEVVATGPGYVFPNGGQTYKSWRMVELTCDDGMASDVYLDTNNVFFINPLLDKDGHYAAALTALADGKKVSFLIQKKTYYTLETGWLKGLHVLTDAVVAP
ncbi:MAG: hypothetical protein D3923_19885 [Candidatus Electrothrix sp. AR3]|nr:hypothetical protein [Candidatus Electrothrix sp. AR3]